MKSIEAIIMRHSLRWSGHLVRMDDNRIPKQLFYGEKKNGKRKASKPKQRHKDQLKSNLKKCKISVDNLEDWATNRPKWRKAVFEGVNLFEKERIQHESYKRSVRKMEQTVPTKGDENSVKCDICGRICLSLAGYKSHMRSHDEGRGQADHFEQNQRSDKSLKNI